MIEIARLALESNGIWGNLVDFALFGYNESMTGLMEAA